MAEEIFSGPQSDTKHKKLLECVLTGNTKLYLGKAYTEEQLKKLGEEEVDKLFNNYEAKLSSQMVKSLGKSIINMYLIGACAALGITNQDALSEDLENDPFLNSALQRFTCELYYRFGLFLAPLSVGIITSRHYLPERNKNGEQTSGASGDNEGPKDPTSGNKEKLMVGIDAASRYKVARPLRTKHARDVAEMIADIYKVGPLMYPKIFQCDNGSEFKGEVNKMLEKHKVKIQ